ncbi:MAG: glycosyltransferase, partial [Deltaproteobacteria bacterium]|nr:glycosyltransferase [Deltaproteobacteria bacterium]
LYLVMSLPVGGAEEHLRTVLQNIDMDSFCPTVCCIREKGQIGEEIETLGIEVLSLKRMSKSVDFRIVMDIGKIIRQRKIHLVHSHLYHANMYGRVAAFFAGISSVTTEHNVYLKKYKMHRRIVNWLLAKRTERIIAVSEMVKNYVIARDWIGSRKVEVIHNGIDLSRFSSRLSKTIAREKLGIPTDCFLLGIVGRLSEQKGHIHLIHAMPAVKESIAEVRLLIVGPGPLEASLRKEVESLALGETVLFLGSRRDIPDILAALDVFVMPSLWEGLPVALLEAMSFSLPAVVSEVGGVAEIIENGENGFMVPPRDGTVLSRTIMELYKNDCLRRHLGKNARKTVAERFNAVTMTKRMESIYHSAIKHEHWKKQPGVISDLME